MTKQKKNKNKSSSEARVARFNPPARGLTLGFPKKLEIRHRYVESVIVASASGLLGTYAFSCNGMYDPNITGTGHQPFYFDQMAALYNHYTVMNSRINVHVGLAAYAGTNTLIGTAGVYIDDDASPTPTVLNACCEQSSATWRTLMISNVEPTQFSASWSAKAAFGGDILDNDNLQGTSGANPTEQQTYMLFVGDNNGLTSCNFWITVTIEYDAVWEELKNIASS